MTTPALSWLDNFFGGSDAAPDDDTDVDAVVVGPNVTTQPTATGDRTLVGGDGATGPDKDSIALGTGASTGDGTGDGHNVALGASSSCGTGGNSECVALGYGATADDFEACALGARTTCNAGAPSSVAIGPSAATFAPHEIAWCGGHAEGVGETRGASIILTNFLLAPGSVELTLDNGFGGGSTTNYTVRDGRRLAMRLLLVVSYAANVDVISQIIAVRRSSGTTVIEQQGTQEVLGANGATLACAVASSPDRLAFTVTTSAAAKIALRIDFVELPT